MPAAILYTGGLNHPSAAILPAWRQILGEAGFTIAASEDLDEVAGWLTAAPQALLVVHALRWMMTQNEKYAPDRAQWAMSPSAAARAALAGHVARGGGLLALHTTSICFDTWPEWQQVLGGGWQWGTSFHPLYGPVRATLDDTHFLARGLPPFEVHDEAYSNLKILPGAKVFGWAECQGIADAPPPAPVMWTWEGSGGRVAYDGLGHDGKSMLDPTHRQLIQRAALWAAHHA